MKEKVLYPVWGGLYILCTLLGGIQNPGIVGHIFLTLLALVFFVPGFLIVAQAVKRRDKKGVLRVRLICIASLSLTLVMYVVNLLSVWVNSQAFGDVMYALLVVVSTPWACCYFGVISLFLWGCLLMFSIPRLWQIIKE